MGVIGLITNRAVRAPPYQRFLYRRNLADRKRTSFFCCAAINMIYRINVIYIYINILLNTSKSANINMKH